MISSTVNYLRNFDNIFNYTYKIDDARNVCEKVPLSDELGYRYELFDPFHLSGRLGYKFNLLEKIGNFLLTPLGRSVQCLSSPTTGKLWKVAAVIIGIAGIAFAIIGAPLKVMGEWLNPLGNVCAAIRGKEQQVQERNREYQKATAVVHHFPHDLKIVDLLDSKCERDDLSDERMQILAELNCIYQSDVFAFENPKPDDWETLTQAKEHLAKIRTAWKDMCTAYAENPRNHNAISDQALKDACGQGGYQERMLSVFEGLIRSSNIVLDRLESDQEQQRKYLSAGILGFNYQVKNAGWTVFD